MIYKVKNMNKDKEYIKPYKKEFFYAYMNYKHKCYNYKSSYILPSFNNLCYAVQIGSGTNQYRVNLMRKFELNLLKRAIMILHSKIELTPKDYDNIHFILSEQRREDLFKIVVDN